MERQELIALLEQAETGTRELSDEVLLALGRRRDYPRSRTYAGAWCTPEGRVVSPERRPSPAESVDDALELKLEGWSVRKIAEWPEGWEVVMIRGAKLATARAATLPLAISAARLRATAVEEK